MVSMQFCLTIIHNTLDIVSCVYVVVSLHLSAIFSAVIFTPALHLQEFFRSFLLGDIIFPLWIAGRLGFKLFKLRKGLKKRKKKAKEHQSVINSISAKLYGLKTPLENASKVQSLSMSELRQSVVAAKDLTVLDALEALQVHLIDLMQSQNSSIAEIVFDADVTAIMADQALKRNEKPLSPLHGIPVCLSNHFKIRGEDCNASAVFKACETAGSDCILVRNIREIGANPVALAKTALLPWEPDASSVLYGTVSHPTHPDRVVGPSSIAVIVEQKGALLGFGLDILGDVRLAAMSVGVVGFKPTAQRLSTEGIVNVVSFSEFLFPTVGIVGLCVSDISDAMKALTSVQSDPSLPLIPFEPSASKEVLSIGIYSSCPNIMPLVPGVERVISEVKATLKAQGHNVVEVELPDPEEVLDLVLQILFTRDAFWDIYACQHLGNSLTWDEVIKCSLTKIPRFLRGLACMAIQFQQNAKCPVMRRLLKAWRKPISAESIRDALEAYRLNFNDLWTGNEIDVLIGPAAAAPALLKNSSACLAFLQTGYSSIFNVVNCPAGVIPFSKVTKEDVSAAAEVKAPSNSLEAQLLNQQKTAEGLPMAVQVIAKPWSDDLVLRVMQELETSHHM
ncbi:hypothetical protein Aperf_G00000042384 [Anoplocephala perfoliata]